MFFKNKHLIVAMIVAPILAVIAYFATDIAVGEKPHAAKPGGLYKLSASPNCRFESGRCTLKNGQLQIEVQGTQVGANNWEFTLRSNQVLDAAALSIVPPNSPEAPPINMQQLEIPEGEEFLSSWTISIGQFDKMNDILRVAISANSAYFYVETSAVFPEFVTRFSE